MKISEVSFKEKIMIKRAIALILVAALTFSLTSCRRKKEPPPEPEPDGFTVDYETFGKTVEMVFFVGENKATIVYADGSSGEVPGLFFDSKKSADGTKAAIMTDRQHHEMLGTLYYTAGSGNPVKVADEVVDYILADSGNALIYWKGFDIEKSTARLYWFNGAESALINGSTISWGEALMFSPTISPDGNTVFYQEPVFTGICEESNKELYEAAAYVSTNGNKGEMLGYGIFPIVAANAAEYLYYVEVTENGLDFVVRKGGLHGESRVLADMDSLEGPIHFNADYSQVVFNAYIPDFSEGYSAFISVFGGEAKMFSFDGAELFIVPGHGQARTGYVADIWYYGFKDFADKVFMTWGSIYVLDKNYDRQLLVNAAHKYILSPNGQTLFYLDEAWGANLNSVSVLTPGEPNRHITSNVDSFNLTVNGQIYYSFDGEFFVRNLRDDTSTKIIAGAINIEIFGESSVYFITGYNPGTGGTLWFAQKDGTAHEITRGVYTVNVCGDFVFYHTEPAHDHFTDVYKGSGGVDFQLFLSNVDSRF
jgi:hypothetical protein